MKTKLITILALVALFGSCEKAEVTMPAEKTAQENKLPYIKCHWSYCPLWVAEETDSGTVYNPPGWYFGGCEWVGQPAYGAAFIDVSDVIDTGYVGGVNVEVLNENAAVIYSTLSDTIGMFYVPDTIRGNTYNVRLRWYDAIDTTLQYTFDTSSTLHPIVILPE
jgi:hypothetical protein